MGAPCTYNVYIHIYIYICYTYIYIYIFIFILCTAHTDLAIFSRHRTGLKRTEHEAHGKHLYSGRLNANRGMLLEPLGSPCSLTWVIAWTVRAIKPKLLIPFGDPKAPITSAVLRISSRSSNSPMQIQHSCMVTWQFLLACGFRVSGFRLNNARARGLESGLTGLRA